MAKEERVTKEERGGLDGSKHCLTKKNIV